MNKRFEHCLYQAGLTAQGCWDELDDYAKQGIEKFATLIMNECIHAVENGGGMCGATSSNKIKEHFELKQ